MVKKIIAIADTHVRNYKRHDEVIEIFEKFISRCKEEASKLEKGELRIVIAGDLFEQKVTISNEANIIVANFLEQLGKIAKTIIICGNHDCLANNTDRVDTILQLIQIGKFKNVTYLDAETEFCSGVIKDNNIVWCLYSIFDNYERPDIELARAKYGEDKVYVGLIHGDINGSVTDTKRVEDKGIDPDVFDNLDFVIAGHIHKRQELKKNGVKIVYCGSLIQKDFGENINGHGYIMWDLETNSYEMVDIENEKYGYYKFSIDDAKDFLNDKETLINI